MLAVLTTGATVAQNLPFLP